MSTAIDMFLKQITLVGGIPFSVTLPEAPASINMDLMTDAQIHEKLAKGLRDAEEGRVQDAEQAFEAFRRTM